MTKQVQFRKGTTAEHFNVTGALAEITVDTDKNVAVVHDGVTGGFELSKSRWTYVAGDTTTGTNQKYTVDSTYSPTGLNVTLPTPRAVGDWVWIEDFGNFMSINPVNIISDQSLENGHLVREKLSPFIMDVSGSVTFIWNALESVQQ